jgi:putative tryptophan/tyrosine transport system substrate-binding protein
MRRREFITLVGGVAATLPLAAHAQKPVMPVIALVNGGAADTQARNASAFRKGLSETGYVEGQNVIVEYHWLEGHYDRLPALLADIVRRKVAVIVTPGTAPVMLAAKAATSTIPIVFGAPEDPVRLGLVKSLAHPSGNATGTNFFSLELNAKRVGLLHELVPKAARIAVLVNPANVASAEPTWNQMKEAARTLGLETFQVEASTPGEIDAAFTVLKHERADALLIAADGFLASRPVQFATLAARERMPASFISREMVEAGLLMSYGTSIADMFRQVGIYAGSILKGAKPSDLPVMQATKFEFIINLQTARLLGLDIPPMLLARADEVIE